VLGECGQFYGAKLEGFSPSVEPSELQDGTTLYTVSFLNWCRKQTYPVWIQLSGRLHVHMSPTTLTAFYNAARECERETRRIHVLT
jgi:hypothetical protein